jgi:beta-glucosidase
LFENPYVSNKDIEELKKINHKPLAEKAAAESFVLLQNNHQTLPISEKYKKILVVGTDAVDARLGGYSGPGNKKVSILDGIKNFVKNKNIEITYSKGIDWNVKIFGLPAEFLSYENQKG